MLLAGAHEALHWFCKSLDEVHPWQKEFTEGPAEQVYESFELYVGTLYNRDNCLLGRDAEIAQVARGLSQRLQERCILPAHFEWRKHSAPWEPILMIFGSFGQVQARMLVDYDIQKDDMLVRFDIFAEA